MNLRPSGYEPDELPNCSTPRYLRNQDCFITIQYFMRFVKHYSGFGKNDSFTFLLPANAVQTCPDGVY